MDLQRNGDALYYVGQGLLELLSDSVVKTIGVQIHLYSLYTGNMIHSFVLLVPHL